MSFLKHDFGKHKAYFHPVLLTDAIYAQILAGLEPKGIEIPQTLRRPDIRLIVNNISGKPIEFFNPAGHSTREQHIPAIGRTAAMIMLREDTLEEQERNARILDGRYGLQENGLTEAFARDLDDGLLKDLVREAYGPAPYGEEKERLQNTVWVDAQGMEKEIEPTLGAAASFGARKPTVETVFLFESPRDMFWMDKIQEAKGTHTAPERLKNDHMYVAVSHNEETRELETRIIVPEVAKGYYGEHIANIPKAFVHPNGFVQCIEINGHKNLFQPDETRKRLKEYLQRAIHDFDPGICALYTTTLMRTPLSDPWRIMQILKHSGLVSQHEADVLMIRTQKTIGRRAARFAGLADCAATFAAAEAGKVMIRKARERAAQIGGFEGFCLRYL